MRKSKIKKQRMLKHALHANRKARRRALRPHLIKAGGGRRDTEAIPDRKLTQMEMLAKIVGMKSGQLLHKKPEDRREQIK